MWQLWNMKNNAGISINVAIQKNSNIVLISPMIGQSHSGIILPENTAQIHMMSSKRMVIAACVF